MDLGRSFVELVGIWMSVSHKKRTPCRLVCCSSEIWSHQAFKLQHIRYEYCMNIASSDLQDLSDGGFDSQVEIETPPI